MKPFLIRGPHDQVVVEGQSVTFQCRVGGDPMPDGMCPHKYLINYFSYQKKIYILLTGKIIHSIFWYNKYIMPNHIDILIIIVIIIEKRYIFHSFIIITKKNFLSAFPISYAILPRIISENVVHKKKFRRQIKINNNDHCFGIQYSIMEAVCIRRKYAFR